MGAPDVKWLSSWSVLLLVSGCLDSTSSPPDVALGPALLGLVCDDLCGSFVDVGVASAMEPTVARDPADPAHLVAANAAFETDAAPLGRLWIHTHVTWDAGRSWQEARFPGGPGAPLDHPLATYTAMGDPVLAFAEDRVLLAGIAARGGGPALAPEQLALLDFALFMASSTDGGSTYSDVRVLARGMGSYNDIYDKPALATGPEGIVVLTWTHFRAIATTSLEELVQADIQFSASRDAGASWTEPGVVAAGHYQGSAPLVSADRWFVAFESTSPVDAPPLAATPLWLASSADAGATWDLRKIGENARGNYVTLRGTTQGDLLLAFATPGGGAAMPAFMWSRDGGLAWADVVALDQIPSSAKPLTAAAIDDAETAFFTWYHAVGSAMEYRAAALRGGVLTGPVRLAAGLEPGFAQRDYAGLAGLREGAFGVWIGGEAPATRVQSGRILLEPAAASA